MEGFHTAGPMMERPVPFLPTLNGRRPYAWPRSLPRSAPRHRDGPVMSANSPLRGRFFNRPLAASPPHPIRSSFTSKSTPPIKRMAWRSLKKRKPAPRRRWLRSVYQESVALASALRPIHHPSCGRLLGQRTVVCLLKQQVMRKTSSIFSLGWQTLTVIYRGGFLLSIA